MPHSFKQQVTKNKFLVVLATLLILLPLAFVIYYISQFYYNVPTWDNWQTTLPAYVKYYHHQLRMHDLWVMHDGHRLLLLRLIFLLNYLIFSGENLPILMLTLILQIATVAVLIYQARFLIADSFVSFVIFAVACAALCIPPNGSGLWLWTMNVQQPLTTFFFILSILAANKIEQHDKYFLYALIFAFLSTISSGLGLIIWPILVVMFFIKKQPRRATALLIGLVVVMIIRYFIDPDSSQIKNFDWLDSIKYFLVFIGNRFNIGTPFIYFFTAANLIAYAALVIRKLKQKHCESHFYPWILISTICFFGALMGALYRASEGGGSDNANIPRYLVISALFWASYFMLLLDYFKLKNLRNKLIVLGLSILFVVLFLIRVQMPPYLHLIITSARLEQISYTNNVYPKYAASQNLSLFGQSPWVSSGLSFLKAHHLAPYNREKFIWYIGNNIYNLGYSTAEIPKSHKTARNTCGLQTAKTLQYSIDFFPNVIEKIFLVDKQGIIYGVGIPNSAGDPYYLFGFHKLTKGSQMFFAFISEGLNVKVPVELKGYAKLYGENKLMPLAIHYTLRKSNTCVRATQLIFPVV